MLQPCRPRRHACLVVCCFAFHLLIPHSVGVRAVAAAPSQQVTPAAQTPEEKLAAALVKLNTDEERLALLAKEPKLENLELRRALIKEAAQQMRQGKYKEARIVLHFTHKFAERIGDRSGVADILRRIGVYHFEQGEFVPAMDYYRQSLTASEKLGDNFLTARALNSIGIFHHDQGEFDVALDYFRRTLAAGESSGDKVMITAWLNNIGNCHRNLGDHESALEYYRKSIAVGEEAKDKAGIALALSNVGIVHHSRGDYLKALEMLRKSLDVNEELGSKFQIARLSLLIGNVHMRQGDFANGLAYYRRTLTISEAAGFKYQVVNALEGIGWYYEHQGELAQALDFYRQSLTAAEALGSKNQIAHLRANVGVVHMLRGEYDAALEQFRESIKLLESLNIQGCAAYVRGQMAETYFLRGDYSGALPAAEQAVAVARRIGIREDLWRAHTTAGKARLALNQPAQARRAFDEAISVIETLRSQVAGGEHERQQFFENKLLPYHLIIKLLVSQNNDADAFANAERAKARVLSDVLQNGRAAINRTLSATEREREQNLKRRLASLNMQAARERGKSSPDAPALSKLEAEIKDARLEYESFQTTLHLTYPGLRAARGETPPINLARAAELLPDDETALLEYVVTENRTYLFVLTRGSDARSPVEIKTYTLPVRAKDLTEQANRFRESIAGRGAFQAQAQELYDTLLRPAATQLKRKRRLVIVPDAALWNVPFQVLRSSANRFLIEDAAVSYAPSLTALAAMRDSPQRKNKTPPDATLLAFGNPALNDEGGAQTLQAAVRSEKGAPLAPLIAAEREVAGLGEIYGAGASRVYIGRDASEARIKTEAGRFRILQFATHGVLDNASPMYSHLVLSQAGDDAPEDGLLEAWEMMNLDLRAEMVVLSACETARGRIGAGEGVIGMSWALFAAGVPTTVVSNWKVSSESTAELMLDFHRNLKKAVAPQSSSKAEALRQAALKQMKSGGAYRHPFYWAAFAVVGDGG